MHHVEGDIIAVVDAAENTVVQYAYGARGEKKGVTGPMATTPGKHNPFRYRGYVYGEGTWIYCLRSRYYYPELQRFIVSNYDDVIVERCLSRIECWQSELSKGSVR